MFEALHAQLLATDGISGTLRGIGMAAESAGDAASETGVEFGALGSALDQVDDDAIAAAMGVNSAQSAIDNLDESASEAGMGVATFKSQLEDIPDGAIASAGSVSELAGELNDLGMTSSAAWRALDSVNDKTEGLIDETLQATATSETFAEQLQDVSTGSMEASSALALAARQMDDTGDEALSSAVQVEALDAALDDLDGTSGSLSASMGPLRGGIGSMAVAASAAIPVVAGLGSALGGLAAAGGAAAAGIGAIAFGGLQRKAENMAAASSQFADSGEAMQAIFENFGSQLKEATEPLQTAANTEFVMSGLEGAIELVGIASRGFAQMAGTLREVGSMFGGAILASAPAVFDELDTTLTALMPSLAAFASMIRDIPQLIAFLRQSAVRLQDELIGFGGASVAAAAGLAQLGTGLMEVVLPPLSVLLGLVGRVAGAIGSLPKPLFAAALAATVAGAAYTWYTGTAIAATTATGALIAAIGVLTAPISATAVAIGALVGAVVGVITYFGAWSDIISFVAGAWNSLVEVVELGIEVTYGMILAIEDLFGPILLLVGGPLATLIWTIANLGEIIKFVGGVFDWFMGVVNTVISTVMGWVDTAIGAIQQLMDWAMSVVNAIPGVNVDFGDVQETVELDALKVGEETESAPEDKDEGRTKKEAQNHYDFRGADFSGTSQSQVEQTVTEAVRKANSESRAREDGQQF